MAYIYKITNKENGKFYIGKTKRKSITRRWFEHQYNARKNDYRHPLYDSIKRYGLEQFEIEIIEECEETVLSEKEIRWIEQLSPQYNLTEGGEGGDTFSKRSEQSKNITRDKLSQHAKKLWQTEEYKNLQSKLAKERWNHDSYRNSQSSEMKSRWENKTYRQIITEKAKELAQKPEHRKKISDSVKQAIATKKDVWSNCKKGSKNSRWLGKIHMYNPDGSLYKEYETAVECSKDTGIVAHNIRTKARNGEPMLTGKFKNYTFKFIKIEDTNDSRNTI